MNICAQGYQDAIHGRPVVSLDNWTEDARLQYLDGYREGTRDIAEQNRPKHRIPSIADLPAGLANEWDDII